MIVVSFIDKQGKEFTQQHETQAAADIALRIALENGCECRLLPDGLDRSVLNKNKE